MKKIICILLLLALTFGILSGCEEVPTATEGTTLPVPSAEATTEATTVPEETTETTSATEETAEATEETTTPATTEAPTTPPATQPSTAPAVCSHTYADATCTAPKTCTKCGATEGNAAGHSYADATCTAPKTCTKCSATEGDPAGHSYADATCTAPKTCTRCGATEGDAAAHELAEESATDGHNVGSVITYRCSVCQATEQKTVEKLTVSAYRSTQICIGDWLSSVGYTASATGGYGSYRYRFEVYVSENASTPALTEDFSSVSGISWTNRNYCNGNILIVTVKDEAENTASVRIVIDTEDSTTDVPVAPPVTEPPVTEPPTTEPPITEPPTTESPTTESTVPTEETVPSDTAPQLTDVTG